MKTFLVENQALIAIGLVCLIATLKFGWSCWHRGYERACRDFANNALYETRHQTSIRK